MHRIFVYGTLLRGFGNYDRLLKGRSTFVKEAETSPIFTMWNLGSFPGVVNKGYTAIKGEIHEVSDDVLRDLDRLEGHPNFYVRTPLRTADGDDCEIYLLSSRWDNDERPQAEIPSGSWREFRRRDREGAIA